MNKMMNSFIIPVFVFTLLVFCGYRGIMYGVSRIQSDSRNLNYITMRERDNDLLCLTDNIYYESAGENAESKISVAQVTLNRLESGKFGKDLCSVVYAKSQFSWTISKPRALKAKNMQAYNESKEVAKKVLLEGFRLSSIKTALWYHADYVNPTWVKDKTKLIKIGQHIFYG